MYTEHYGLTGNPFQLTPDPRFWFESDTHRKAMAYLGYGLAQGEGFIVVTGDIGAGKTTLVAHLMATVDSSRLTAVELVSTQVEGDDMVRLVAQRLGLPAEGAVKAQLLDRIERFFHEQARNGRRTLLIVDEAQNLGTTALEELRMLSNFQSGGRALVQIFLLGQPEFRERVKKAPGLEQLRQRVIATHHLEPMQAAEIEPYVVHRLSVAGWQGVPQFTAEAFGVLYRETGGVPRKLNTLMSRVLLYGAVEELKVIDCRAVDAVVADIAGDQKQPDPADEPLAVEPQTEASEPEPVQPPETHRAETESLSAWPVEAQHAAPASEEDGQPAAETPAPHAAQDDRSAVEEFEASGSDIGGTEPATPVDDDRLAALEERLAEQEAALVRVLTLLVQWVEEEEARPHLDVVGGSAA